jgi:hypothetical protein
LRYDSEYLRPASDTGKVGLKAFAEAINRSAVVEITGHRVDCPACTTKALVFGDPIAAAHKTIVGDEITEVQEYLPSKFECVACKLKIAGLSRLSAAGIGSRYKKTSVYDAAAYYAPNDELHEYEDDNNEPY